MVKVYLPLCHTTLNGTDGQRTARTTSCGPPSAAIGITSMSGTRECHNNGASSSRGRVSVASCVKYKLALLVSSVPPSKDLKMSASFSHSALADATTGRKGIIPVLVLVNALLYLGCCFQRTSVEKTAPITQAKHKHQWISCLNIKQASFCNQGHWFLRDGTEQWFLSKVH